MCKSGPAPPQTNRSQPWRRHADHKSRANSGHFLVSHPKSHASRSLVLTYRSGAEVDSQMTRSTHVRAVGDLISIGSVREMGCGSRRERRCGRDPTGRTSAGRRLRRYAARLVAVLGDGGGAALGARVAGLGCGRRDGAGSDDPRARVRARLRLPPRAACSSRSRGRQGHPDHGDGVRGDPLGGAVPTSSLTARIDVAALSLTLSVVEASDLAATGDYELAAGRRTGGAPPSMTSPGHRRALILTFSGPAPRCCPWDGGGPAGRDPVPGLGRSARGRRPGRDAGA